MRLVRRTSRRRSLPRRQANKVPSIQQPDFAEENPIYKGDGSQLLQGETGLKFKFLFLYQESHGQAQQEKPRDLQQPSGAAQVTHRCRKKLPLFQE